MSTTTSPNMNLIVPTAGQEPGPTYATDINTDIGIVDQHDHSPGNGVQITPAGMNINAALSFQSNYATNVNGVNLIVNTADTTLQSLYVKNGTESPAPIADLWYNDGAGNAIQITANGGINATSASIPGESFAFGTFFWKQGAGSTTPANFDIGSVTIRPNVAATTFGVTLTPPTSISSAYTINLPALPAAASFLTIDNSGVMTASPFLANGITAANIANNTITAAQIANATITTTQIAANTILDGNIALQTITGDAGGAGTGSIALATITGDNIAANSVLPGNLTVATSWVNTPISGTLTNTNVSSTISSFIPIRSRPISYNFTGSLTQASSAAAITVTITITSGLGTLLTNSFTMPASTSGVVIPMSAFNFTPIANNVGATHTTTVNIAASGSTLTYSNISMTVVQG